MKAIVTLVSLSTVLVLAAPSARAEGIGLGAQTLLTRDIGAASLTYDTGAFHIDGLFSLIAGDATGFLLGGQFWYGIHGGGVADLSVGGGLGVVDEGDDDLDIDLQGGLKLRLFLVSNVALSTVVGIGFSFDDDDDDDFDDEDIVLIGGDLVGSMGITYFF